MRSARRRLLSGLAAAHLLLFAVLSRGAGSVRAAGLLAVTAFAVPVFLIFRDLPTARDRDRRPDLPPILAWGAAGLLEIHAFVPSVAASRIVPALLFPLLALGLPPAPMAAWGLLSLAWLILTTGSGWPPEPGTALGLLTLALLATGAGLALRRRPAGDMAVPEGPPRPHGSYRDLLRAWADPEEGTDPAEGAPPEDAEFTRRGEEIGEGIRRILEGLLPLSGADRVAFVVRAREPGRPFRIAGIAPGTSPADGDVGSISDSFVPLREAFLFGRSFFGDGAEAAAYRIRIGGREAAPGGIAAVPVPVGNRVEAAFLALRDEGGRWPEPVVPLLEMGARFAAREIETARRLTDEARARIRQESFHGLVRHVAEVAERGGGADPSDPSLRGEIYAETVARIREHLGVDRVFLIESDEAMTRGRLAALALSPAEGMGRGGAPRSGGRGEEGGAPVPLEGTYIEWVLQNGVIRSFTALGSSPPKHPVFPRPWSDARDEACLLMPVTGAGGFRGVLACAAAAPRAFPGADADAAADFLAIMRMGLSHVRQIEELGARATVDGLTGLLNRRTFLERLGKVLDRLDGRHPAAVIMLDLDHFKRINDTYGHPAGDEVLRKAASVIGKTIRKMDFAGRYGGEEFVVFLSQADPSHALQAAERLRLAVRKVRLAFGRSEVAVTASLGVACYPIHGRTPDEILRRADEALYRSKEGGRDRVTAA